jgi:Peptidase A4 family
VIVTSLLGGVASSSAQADPPARSSHVGLRKVSIARVTATPAALSASGGKVRLQAVVRGATKCRFSSATTLKGLPSTKRCSSGRASVSITLPNNTTSSAKTYGFDLTASRAGGTSARRRLVVVEQALTRAALAPVITTQPASQSLTAGGGSVTFIAAASGDPTPSVQWQVSADGGSTWINIAGATSTSYQLTTFYSGNNGYEYRAVFTNPAGSATTNAATLTIVPDSIPSQSGYTTVTPDEAFSAVSANWIVPTVTCPPGANTGAAQWPGLSIGPPTGGFYVLLQDGTAVGCSSGTAFYYAWYELYGDSNLNDGLDVGLNPSQYPVAPGDAIAASVSISGANWTLSLTDTTNGWTFTFTTPTPAPDQGPYQGNAEVIVEAGPGSLANFGAIDFTGATAELDGKTRPLTAFAPEAFQMTNGSTLEAAPGPLDPEGDFTDTWYAN